MWDVHSSNILDNFVHYNSAKDRIFCHVVYYEILNTIRDFIDMHMALGWCCGVVVQDAAHLTLVAWVRFPIRVLRSFRTEISATWLYLQVGVNEKQLAPRMAEVWMVVCMNSKSLREVAIYKHEYLCFWNVIMVLACFKLNTITINWKI